MGGLCIFASVLVLGPNRGWKIETEIELGQIEVMKVRINAGDSIKMEPTRIIAS